jgi:hypothetical protein
MVYIEIMLKTLIYDRDSRRGRDEDRYMGTEGGK